MLIHKFFRLLNDTPGESGSTPAPVVDRGDLLIPEDTDLDPDNPDAKLAEVKADPAVKKLEAEIQAEAPTEPEADPEAETDHKKDTRIPQSRHKEILEKERAKTSAALAELAQLKQREQLASTGAAANADFEALEAEVLKLEEEYANLLTDGEIKKATAVMAKIRQSERHMAETKADLKIKAATVQASEATRYQAMLSRVEAAYPAINPEHDDYDPIQEQRVIKLARVNQQDGMTSAAALQDAVETLFGVPDTPAPNTRTQAKDVGAERKKEAVAKTAKALGDTPPSLGRVGLDSDKLGGGSESAAAVIKLSQKEFAALSDSALAKLRGDEL